MTAKASMFIPSRECGVYIILRVLLCVSHVSSILNYEGNVKTVAGGGAPHHGAKSDCFENTTAVDGFGTEARFNYPWGITYHGLEDTLYVGDCSCPDKKHFTANEKIRKVELKIGRVTSLAGGAMGYEDGPGKDAQFKHISGMAIDPVFNQMYIVDSGNERIRKVDLKLGFVSTFAGSGKTGFVNDFGTKAEFNNPQQLTIDIRHNVLYVADTDNHAIRSITLEDGLVQTLAGGTQGHKDGEREQAKFYHPTGIALDSTNNVLYVSDHYNHVIRIVRIDNGKVSTLAGGGREGYKDGAGKAARFNYPEGLAYDPEYQLIYVVEFDNNAVRVVNLDGEVATLAGGRNEGYYDGKGEKAKFFHPTGVAFDSVRKILYITDQYNHMVRSVTAIGFDGRLPYPYRLFTWFSLVCVSSLVFLVLSRRYWWNYIARRRHLFGP